MTRTITAVLALVLLTVLDIHASVLQHGKAVHSTVYDNLIFETHLLVILQNVPSALNCICMCGQFNECLSLFYDKPNKLCRLHNVMVFSNADGVTSPGWTFYRYGESGCPFHLGFISNQEGLCVYLAVSSIYTYEEGQHLCEARNSRIITLETAEKRQAFQNLMNKLLENDDLYPLINGKQFYLGLKHDGSGWHWKSDESIQEEFIWGSGQPYCPSAPCACMTAFQIWNWKWNDISCSESHKVVCEYTGHLLK
ncbi:C-type lectin domain family 6 member A-like [Mercenaria mercenaria]|uniref:C-type lectin domain family 6 member A-like n=1 Tax=Mercenaria mercenaria TaxID=6596 RepID=UPI001E1DB052|nr:C-type lectin domain family 6 member A-like [Mercenaria mercenaria]